MFDYKGTKYTEEEIEAKVTELMDRRQEEKDYNNARARERAREKREAVW